MARKIKIEIKSWTGQVLFEYSSTDNTVKKTLLEAVKKGANLRRADLWGADLREANLREADLREADLRRADLREADLWGADLGRADLWGADLRRADLREADLWGAKNFTPVYQSDLAILKAQPGKLRAYKYLNGDKSPYQNHKYEVGKIYTCKKYSDDIFETCGKGLNVATLDWCLRDSDCDLNKTYVEVEFSAKDIVAIPYASDGKFRVKKLKVLRKMPKKELEDYLKSLS